MRPQGATDFSNIANGAAILFSVLININGDIAYNAPAPWNNLGLYPSNDQLFTGFRDLNGNETGIRIFVEQTMSGFNDWGTSTGDDSGVYPDLVMKSFFFNDALVDPGRFVIEGLDQSLNYNFTFFGAIETGFNIFTNFTIGDQTVTNAQTYNTTETSSIFGVAPDINSEARLMVQEAPGSNWAIFNAMVIDAYPVPAESAGSLARTAAANTPTQFISETGTEVYFGNEKKYEIEIFPVPVIENVSIKTSGVDAGNLHVRMIDLAGKVYVEQVFETASNPRFDINAAGFPAGVYVIELTDEAGEIKTFKIIKF
jgi:hypothetical protein